MRNEMKISTLIPIVKLPATVNISILHYVEQYLLCTCQGKIHEYARCIGIHHVLWSYHAGFV